MKALTKILILLLFISIAGCSSSELIENWKNPDIETFEAQKVLVLAMSNDVENRRIFEDRLVSQLKEKGVNAVNSDEFFSPEFTSRPRTEEELDALENEMLLEGFDAILVSKIIGSEDRKTLVQTYKEFDKIFKDFEEDYRAGQDLYIENEREEFYLVYHAESALYCICPEAERQVIWKGAIDVSKPDRERKAIKDYINLLMWVLEEQELLINTNNS